MVAMGMENVKMQSPFRCNKRTEGHGPANHPVSFTAVWGRIWKFGKFEAFDHKGTVFAPKQYVYQKIAMGVENLKM